MALPATDAFTRADASTLGANWTSAGGTLGINTNQAAGISGGQNNFSYWSADVFDDDHYSQHIHRAGTSGAMGRLTFTAGPDLADGYLVHPAGIFLLNDNGFSLIGSVSGSPSAGDVVRIECEGTAIRAYLNGVQNGSTVVDGTHASGSAGFLLHDTTGRADDWEGGNLFYTPGAVGVDRMNLRQFPKAFMRRKS
jgi:hypothetical protein